jgi:hypothetical protein
VHRLSELGAVVTQTLKGTSQEGLDAEWRTIEIFTVEGDLLSRCEAFDETDLDAALARFEELHSQLPRLENAASRLHERFLEYYAAGDSQAMAEMLADNYCSDDRRRVVGSGVRNGRDAHIADMRARAELWNTNLESTVMAIRGERLALMCIGLSDRDEEPEAFSTVVLAIGEIDADERLVASVTFDLDQIDAAFADLDARYLGGEAAAHAHTWSAIAQAYAAVNRHELPATTQGWVNIDHRRGRAFVPGDLEAYLRATWDVLTPDVRVYIEKVHRLSKLGAVVTRVAKGTSREGFDAEWREIGISTVEGDLISRSELFDEADLDAALARFEELQPQARRLENAASQVAERFWAYFESRDWDAMAAIIADDCCTYDRRRVVSADVLRGRAAHVTNMRAVAEVGFGGLTSSVLATREHRLALIRIHSSARGSAPGEVTAEMVSVIEIDTDNLLTGAVIFDSDDIDAAIEELEARYLAAEASVHSHTWSVVTQTYAAFNRHEILPTSPDWINVDHRRLARVSIQPNDMTTYLRAIWDLTPDLTIYAEAVHRLSERGAVVTHGAHGRSPQGFEAEWRMVEVLMVESELIGRCELFDEADIDAALARFDELSRSVPHRVNAASRVHAHLRARVAARKWNALSEILADDITIDDRRRAVNSGIQYGRDAAVADMRGAIELGLTNISLTVIATRGVRLELCRMCISSQDRPDAFRIEFLSVVEINADERIVARVAFDLDDIDAAFEELEARYLAGEAAAYASTWSVIARTYAAFNRHEFPSTTTGSVYIDHRPLVTNDASDLAANIRATWELMDVSTFIAESVHRLSELGAVVTQTLKGTSKEGLDVDYRMIDIFTVEHDLLSRCEVFDEADLDAALARFDELHPQAPRLENAASQLVERFRTYFAARNWAAVAENSAHEIFTDDRRSVVGSGILRGRDIDVANIRAIADLGATDLTSTVIATRGERLVLTRIRLSGRDQRPEAFHSEMLGIVEIDADNRVAARFLFDLDDIDAAFEELDTRYLAGEAAAHADTWSVIARINAAFNRRELPEADWVTIDHRPLPLIEADSQAALQVWEVTPDFDIHSETVHRLGGFGAVATYQANGASPEGFGGEWRIILLLIVEGDRIDRCEVFDESDLDVALARFDELQPQMPRLENAAGRIVERYFAHFAAHDWAAFAELLADDIVADDRRRVVNAGIRRGRDVHIADMRAIVEVSAPTFSSSIIATRGERLALAHVRIFNRGMTSEVGAEALGIGEIDSDERIVATISFDLDDIDAALAELEARYLAGEASDYAHTWSVITHTYAAFNRHELAAADWVTIDHRRLVAIDPNDMAATIRAVWDLTPQVSIHVEAVHRLSSFGAVVTDTMCGTSPEGFDAEWRMVQLLTVEGDRIKRCEVFDEADLDTGLARFDELEQRTASIANVATRAWTHVADAFNRRDVDGLLALANPESRYEDRRKGLRDIVEGSLRRKSLDVMFETVPSSWRMEVEPIAIRGSRLSLTRGCYRDVDDADRPIAVELLHVIELDDADLIRDIVSFDPDDLDDAFAELTARWIASGEVAYPEVIEAVDRINATINRHDWDSVATHFAGAEYVNHRQLAQAVDGTIADWLSSMQTTGSLVPNFWVEMAEVLARSAIGIVERLALKGTSTDGVAVEISFVVLILIHGERVTRLEVFEEDERDAALSRLQEFNRPV